MARHQLALDLDTSTDTGTEPSTGPPTPGRQVVLHVHLSDQAITGPATQPGDRLHLARVANTRRSSTPSRSAPGAASPAPR